MSKTKVIRPVDIDDHFALRRRVALLEVVLTEALAALAATHPEEAYLKSLADQILPEPTP